MNRNIKRGGDDWIVVHSTSDEWKTRLIQTALLNEKIQCRMQPSRRPDGSTHWVIMVLNSKQVDAMEIISRVELAIASDVNSQQNESSPVVDKNYQEEEIEVDEEDELPEINLEAVEQTLIASREGIGEIIHYSGVGYELRVGPQPYYIVNEDRWEEFIDFSAQRQEFSILLRGEYKRLFNWLKAEKLMAEFIKLVESTYREVPSPKLKKRKEKTKKQNETEQSVETVDSEHQTSYFSIMCLALALFSVVVVIFKLPWYAGFILALLALGVSLAAKYHIDSSKGKIHGILWAIIGMIIACIMLVISLILR